MAEMMFYQNLVSLDSKAHGAMKVRQAGGLSFAAGCNSVPLVGQEFFDVAKELPIVFVKGGDGEFLPVALLGLRNNENLMINADGLWKGRYLPAFIRRYPFVPAQVKEGEMAICIDDAATCLSREEGEALFADDKPTPFLQGVIRLLQDYQVAAERTVAFSKGLRDSNLLIESNAEARMQNGESFRLSGLYVVDEKRLQVLDKERVHALFVSGELGLIYSHLLSLGNVQVLVEKLTEKLKDAA